MELAAINAAIVRGLGKKLNVRVEKKLSAPLLDRICSKLSDGTVSGGTLADLFTLLKTIGIDISHIDQNKVKRGDEVHTYLLLDFLNLLFEALLCDNPSAFNKLVKRFARVADNEQVASENEKEGTTSGAEEVDKILREARRKYGRIRSLQAQIEKENISIIPKLPPRTRGESQVDHAEVKTARHKLVGRTSPVSVKQKNVTPESEITERTESVSGVSSNSSKFHSSVMSDDSSGPSRDTRKKKPAVKRKSSALECENETTEHVDDTQVNIRIPLDDASVNVKVKRTDGQPLGNRRIHIRLREEPEPKRSKKIYYGSKSVLTHHHRKTRPPMFSRPPLSPVKSDDTVLKEAVTAIRSERAQELRQKDVEAVAELHQAKISKPVNCKLDNQRALREIRTRKCQLKKLAEQLEK